MSDADKNGTQIMPVQAAQKAIEDERRRLMRAHAIATLKANLESGGESSMIGVSQARDLRCSCSANQDSSEIGRRRCSDQQIKLQ